jgi:hypothetical protein
MSTVTLKINDETKAGKALLAMIEFFKNQKGVELVDTKTNSADDEAQYNPEFVKMVLDAAKEKGGREIDPKKLWENIK